jgi:hypothetical protein
MRGSTPATSLAQTLEGHSRAKPSSVQGSAITVTAVRLTGTGGAKLALRTGAPPFSSDSPLSLPIRIAPRHTLWLGYSVAIRPCSGLTATVIRVQVNYVEHRETRTQTSPAVHNDVSQICP